MRSSRKDFIELHRPQVPEHQEARDQEAKVADTVGDKGLLGSVRVGPGGARQRVHLVPEANEQEGAKPHPLPTDEQHQVRIAADQNHHRQDEQIEEHEEAAVAAHVVLEAHVFVHVADGVDVDERADARNHQHHRDRKRIHAEGPVQLQRADVYPFGQEDGLPLPVIGPQGIRQQHGNDERSARSRAGQPADAAFRQPFADDQVQQQPSQREEHHPGG